MDSRHSALAAQREKGDRSDACGTAPAATKRAKQALMDATQHLSANNPEAAAACFAQAYECDNSQHQAPLDAARAFLAARRWREAALWGTTAFNLAEASRTLDRAARLTEAACVCADAELAAPGACPRVSQLLERALAAAAAPGGSCDARVDERAVLALLHLACCAPAAPDYARIVVLRRRHDRAMLGCRAWWERLCAAYEVAPAVHAAALRECRTRLAHVLAGAAVSARDREQLAALCKQLRDSNSSSSNAVDQASTLLEQQEDLCAIGAPRECACGGVQSEKEEAPPMTREAWVARCGEGLALERVCRVVAELRARRAAWLDDVAAFVRTFFGRVRAFRRAFACDGIEEMLVLFLLDTTDALAGLFAPHPSAAVADFSLQDCSSVWTSLTAHRQRGARSGRVCSTFFVLTYLRNCARQPRFNQTPLKSEIRAALDRLRTQRRPVPPPSKPSPRWLDTLSGSDSEGEDEVSQHIRPYDWTQPVSTFADTLGQSTESVFSIDERTADEIRARVASVDECELDYAHKALSDLVTLLEQEEHREKVESKLAQQEFDLAKSFQQAPSEAPKPLVDMSEDIDVDEVKSTSISCAPTTNVILAQHFTAPSPPPPPPLAFSVTAAETSTTTTSATTDQNPFWLDGINQSQAPKVSGLFGSGSSTQAQPPLFDTTGFSSFGGALDDKSKDDKSDTDDKREESDDDEGESDDETSDTDVGDGDEEEETGNNPAVQAFDCTQSFQQVPSEASRPLVDTNNDTDVDVKPTSVSRVPITNVILAQHVAAPPLPLGFSVTAAETSTTTTSATIDLKSSWLDGIQKQQEPKVSGLFGSGSSTQAQAQPTLFDKTGFGSFGCVLDGKSEDDKVGSEKTIEKPTEQTFDLAKSLQQAPSETPKPLVDTSKGTDVDDGDEKTGNNLSGQAFDWTKSLQQASSETPKPLVDTSKDTGVDDVKPASVQCAPKDVLLGLPFAQPLSLVFSGFGTSTSANAKECPGQQVSEEHKKEDDKKEDASGKQSSVGLAESAALAAAIGECVDGGAETQQEEALTSESTAQEQAGEATKEGIDASQHPAEQGNKKEDVAEQAESVKSVDGSASITVNDKCEHDSDEPQHEDEVPASTDGKEEPNDEATEEKEDDREEAIDSAEVPKSVESTNDSSSAAVKDEHAEDIEAQQEAAPACDATPKEQDVEATKEEESDAQHQTEQEKDDKKCVEETPAETQESVELIVDAPSAAAYDEHEDENADQKQETSRPEMAEGKEQDSVTAQHQTEEKESDKEEETDSAEACKSVDSTNDSTPAVGSDKGKHANKAETQEEEAPTAQTIDGEIDATSTGDTSGSTETTDGAQSTAVNTDHEDENVESKQEMSTSETMEGKEKDVVAETPTSIESTNDSSSAAMKDEHEEDIETQQKTAPSTEEIAKEQDGEVTEEKESDAMEHPEQDYKKEDVSEQPETVKSVDDAASAAVKDECEHDSDEPQHEDKVPVSIEVREEPNDVGKTTEKEENGCNKEEDIGSAEALKSVESTNDSTPAVGSDEGKHAGLAEMQQEAEVTTPTTQVGTEGENDATQHQTEEKEENECDKEEDVYAADAQKSVESMNDSTPADGCDENKRVDETKMQEAAATAEGKREPEGAAETEERNETQQVPDISFTSISDITGGADAFSRAAGRGVSGVRNMWKKK